MLMPVLYDRDILHCKLYNLMFFYAFISGALVVLVLLIVYLSVCRFLLKNRCHFQLLNKD